MKDLQSKNQTGFTIVELMIATLVFSIILIVITTGVMQFTKSYYQGINSTNTQNVTRSAIDKLSQAIQFTGSNVQVGANVVCIGDQKYSYRIGKKLSTTVTADTAQQVLYQKPMGATCTTTDFTAGGKELMGKNMRLAAFSVTNLAAPNNNLWSINMRVAYGDLDLLCSPSIAPASPGGCKATSASLTGAQAAAAPNMICRPTNGSQFCSVSALNTTVVKRMVQ